MRSRPVAAALLATVAAHALPAAADPIPPGWTAKNFEAVGFTATPAFKLAIREHQGRWYLYTAARPGGISVIDVTDPTDPRVVRNLPSPPQTLESQVSVHGDLMITGMSRTFPKELYADPTQGDPTATVQAATPPNRAFGEGVRIWSLADPAHPKELSRWGAGAVGTHRNIYPGGRYAFLTSTAPGYRGFILIVLDIGDPAHPKEAGRWWYPGQKADETPGEIVPTFHGPVAVSPDGKTAIAGYTPAVVNLDLADLTRPKLVGKLVLAPPITDSGPQSLHTAVPVQGGKLIFFNSESRAANCKEGWQGAGLIDNSNPAKPELLSVFPVPVPPPQAPYANFCDKPGRFGPHNTNTELHSPDVEPVSDHIYLTYFNAGLRYFDIRDPRLPKETGWFVPPNPASGSAQAQVGPVAVTQAQDVLVDRRGYAYVSDSAWGVWIVRYTGP